MNVLIDSSVWIAYFRGTGEADSVDALLDEGLAVTNDLILAELIPALTVRRQRRVIRLLQAMQRYPVAIDWDEIVEAQVACLSHGIGGVGIPDLIIAQNAMQNDLHLFASDKHFAHLARHLPLSVY
jgi:predicted nucleic acid-binding protein